MRHLSSLLLALVVALVLAVPAFAGDFEDGNAAFDRGDYPEALRLLERVAAGGHDGAQNRVGYMYANGLGTPRDDAEAVRWYRMSAEKGNGNAQNNLGTMYDNGRGVPEDDLEAVRWYRLGADKGSPNAQRNLGYAYQMGEGLPRDYDEAIKWYRKAADQGHVNAYNDLGVMYQNGYGVPVDAVEAVRWYRLGAGKGNANAQNNLGIMYRNGSGVPQDDAEAARWYRLAADQGNASAQRNLGYSYQNGLGVTKDYAEAAKWYRKAADGGNLNATNDMGVMYRNGWGVEKNEEEAVRWYRKAAERGHPHGLNNLARAYVDGRAGKIDLKEAFRLFQLAAVSNDKSAAETANKLIAELPEWVRNGDSEPVVTTTPPTTTTTNRPRPTTVPNAPARIIPGCAGSDIPAVRTDQKRVALVIGQSAYENVTPLPNPKCDAMAMAATLEKAGFEVVTGYDLDKPGLEAAARAFVRIAANADVSLFFYAGHGLQVDGVNYMVPVDAKVEDATAIRFELIDIDSITAFMSGPDKVGIILLDACRDNPFAAKLARTLSRNTDVGAGLAAIRNEGGGMVIGFATAPGDVAADGIGEHSPFTTALLEELPSAGVDFEIVMRQVKARVVELTENEPSPQRPWTNSDLTTAFVLYPE